MPIDPRILDINADMRDWRQHLHAHPETAFEEYKTADFIAAKLGEFGVEVNRGLAGTGVVGTVKGRRPGTRAIGLRADMDALNIEEQTNLGYRSSVPGKMHACGHDGHMTMLLGAARHLASDPDFAGTVHLIFQPAEEAGGGGKVMIDEGLFEKFPVDCVYGMHNWPGLGVGEFAVRPGPILGASAYFELKIEGVAAHAAMPHLGVDAIVVASEIVNAMQSVVSRTVDPLDAAVVSITWIKGGDAWNIIPREVRLGAIVRYFRDEVGAGIETGVRRIAGNVAAAHGATVTLDYADSYPATVNAEAETAVAAEAAAATVGEAKVNRDIAPSLASEDFSYMLCEKPGCYILIGNGPGGDGRQLHSPGYDFNDESLGTGAGYWVNLVQRVLGAAA